MGRMTFLRPESIGRGKYRDALIPASEPLLNTWVNVTPPAVAANLSNKDFGGLASNFGGQDIFADPARPQDVYAGFCYQGIWKSTNYGKAGSWVKINAGTESANLDGGRPWSGSINPLASRDPNTAPRIHWMSGYGPQWGVYYSDDGCVNHTRVNTGASSEDIYAYAVNPYNPLDMLCTLHGTTEILRSANGGLAWTQLTSAANDVSAYPYFVDTGNPVTTALTILSVAQGGIGASTRLSTNGGTSWSTPTNGASIGHQHGASQAAMLGGGLVYLGGSGGVWKSTDSCATFTLDDSAQESNGVLATSKRLISTYGWATQDANDPRPRTKLLSGGGWSDMTFPGGITNGAKRGTYLRNGIYDVVILNCWLAGMWRWVEVGA